jgi:hypothetical protein
MRAKGTKGFSQRYFAKEFAMNFREYLEKQKMHSDNRGDFIRLALADVDLPDMRSCDELRSYMMTRHQSHHLSDVASIVWKDFEADKRKEVRRAMRDV